MTWRNRDATAIVGIGRTEVFPRGGSFPRTISSLACEAIIAACEDAGISVKDLDGFAYYASAKAGYVESFDTGSLMETLGIPQVTFSAALTSGGGGSVGAVGLAAAALMNGDCRYCVTVMALQQPPKQRLGKVFAAMPPDPENSFTQPSGLVGPGHMIAMLTRRHMHLYGTDRRALAEVVLASREHARGRAGALRPDGLSLEEYFNSPMLADPLCKLDFCLETDGAVAVITTTADRAANCRNRPALVHACAHGGTKNWGRGFAWMGMPDPEFASSGHKLIADRIWQQSGLSASQIDVAQIYDHFSPMVLMQLEDYGFCARGEGGDYVLEGNLRLDPSTGRGTNGHAPVNTHGGNLSDAYIIGMTHIVEGVEQIRGTAANQVRDCQFALVTGGPASLPVSGMILRKAS